MSEWDKIIVPVEIPVNKDELDQAVSSLESVRQLTDSISMEDGENDKLGLFSHLGESLNSLRSSLNQIRPLMDSMGGGFKNIFAEIQDAAAGMTNVFKTFDGNFESISNKLLAWSANFSAAQQRIDMIRKTSSADLGWSKQEFMKNMPIIMSRMGHAKIKELSENSFREETVKSISHNDLKLNCKNDFIGIHTYNTVNNVEVVDLKIKGKFNVLNTLGAVIKKIKMIIK